MSKKTIIINPLDNVAVALCDLKKGETHEGVTLSEDITKGHKFTLHAIKKGENIIKIRQPDCLRHCGHRQGRARPHPQRAHQPF